MKNKTTQFMKEHKEEIEWRDVPFSLYEHPIQEILSGMGDANAPERAHRRFERLCDLAGQAYRDHQQLTDEEIQAAPITPLLMRYLLDALKSYGARIATAQNVTTAKRREFLAAAFAVENDKRGGNTRGKMWSEDLKMRVDRTFSAALWEAIEKAGLPEQQAWLDAFERTYQSYYFEPEGGRDHRQSSKERFELAVELVRMGHDFRHFGLDPEMVMRSRDIKLT